MLWVPSLCPEVLLPLTWLVRVFGMYGRRLRWPGSFLRVSFRRPCLALPAAVSSVPFAGAGAEWAPKLE